MHYKELDQSRFAGFVKRIDSETTITMVPTTDPNNIEFKQYLEWLAAGNTPLPADE